eukprot:12934403-Prorocentrum_lima.AAC.1
MPSRVSWPVRRRQKVPGIIGQRAKQRWRCNTLQWVDIIPGQACWTPEAVPNPGKQKLNEAARLDTKRASQ